MNLICIISDTMRRDHLGCYGAKSMQTPNLDRLAAQSVVFDRAYCGSFPTLPCRAEMFTGKFIFPYLQWSALPPKEVTVAEILNDHGYHCAMVTDNLHLCRERYDYARGFHTRIRVRGQWYDNYQPADAPFTWPCSQDKLAHCDNGRMQQYLRNTEIRRGEEDFFAPRVVREAIHWLERNHDRSPFYLYVDLFDPHEPWDPPQRYLDLYSTPGDQVERIIDPVPGPADRYSEKNIRDINALYSGELTLVDTWLGRLLDAVEALGRQDDTAVLFLSDHGMFLGERGLLGKMGGRGQGLVGWPTFWELAHVPYMIRLPGVAPARSRAFVHPGDVAPTLLSLAGLPIPAQMTAADLTPVVRGEVDSVRDMAISSWSLRDWSVHRPSVLRTDEWTFVYWRVGVKPQLFHLPSDPGEEHDVFTENVSVARELHRRYVAFLRDNGVTSQNYWPRSKMWVFGSTSEESHYIPRNA